VTGDTLITLSDKKISIEDLFNRFDYRVIQDQGKEYAIPRTELEKENNAVLGYNAFEDEAVLGEIAYVMRHKTKKKLYEIETDDGKKVTVTEDHSLIVDRHGITTEVTPKNLEEDDLIITI